jgi:glycerol uptake facilitator-like aquaporin
MSYAIGTILAVSISAPVSGGHLSPGITIAATIFKGFPPLKAVRYIIAQILGAFVACLVVYAQYHDQIKSLSAALEAQGVLDKINFTPEGIAGSFACYAPAGASLGYVFFNEFICVSTLRCPSFCYVLIYFGDTDFHPRYSRLGLHRPHEFLRPHLVHFGDYRFRLRHDHLGLRASWAFGQHGS